MCYIGLSVMVVTIIIIPRVWLYCPPMQKQQLPMFMGALPPPKTPLGAPSQTPGGAPPQTPLGARPPDPLGVLLSDTLEVRGGYIGARNG